MFVYFTNEWKSRDYSLIPISPPKSGASDSRYLAHCKTDRICSSGHRDGTRGAPQLSTESIVIEIPGWFLDGQRERKGAHRAQFPPVGVRRERAPALVIPRLKASFNIYDLFRFNSTRKREAYLYSATARLTRSRRGKLANRE